jgi:hypothetical protein
MLQKFLELLRCSSAVSVDHGALCSNWDTAEVTGGPDNEVVCFTWTDGECDYISKLTEFGISAGAFDDNGTFACLDHAEERTVIRFYQVTQITALDSSRNPITLAACQATTGGMMQYAISLEHALCFFTGTERSGSIGNHDWCIKLSEEDGVAVFVDDRQLSYRPSEASARAYAFQVIARLRANGDYRLNDRPAGFLPPERSEIGLPELLGLQTLVEHALAKQGIHVYTSNDVPGNWGFTGCDVDSYEARADAVYAAFCASF